MEQKHEKTWKQQLMVVNSNQEGMDQNQPCQTIGEHPNKDWFGHLGDVHQGVNATAK